MKISVHKSGLCYTTITIDKQKKFIYGSTPEEVEEKYNEMKYLKKRGYRVEKNPTLEEYMIEWYQTYKKDKGAIKTQKMYQNCINNHINPALGKKKIKDITGTNVQQLLNSIKSSKSLAHKVRITLNQIYKTAIADRLVTFNPVSNTKSIAPNTPKRNILSPLQRELLLKILDGDPFYPIMFTILYTGMRMGEALALLKADIDLENGLISVSKALEYKNSIPLEKPPKTENGYREIPIHTNLSEYLKEYLEKIKGNVVFPWKDGKYLTATQIDRMYRNAVKKIDAFFDEKENANLKEHYFKLNYRLLRHTFCTGLYDAEIDEVSASEIMGHDVLTMRTIYTHIQNKRKVKTAIKLNKIYEE